MEEGIKGVVVPQEMIIIDNPLRRKTIKLTSRAVGGISLHPAYDVFIVDGFTANVVNKQGYSHTSDDIAVLIYYGGNKRG